MVEVERGHAGPAQEDLGAEVRHPGPIRGEHRGHVTSLRQSQLTCCCRGRRWWRPWGSAWAPRSGSCRRTGSGSRSTTEIETEIMTGTENCSGSMSRTEIAGKCLLARGEIITADKFNK